jgi:hypothetical protein
VHHVRGMRLGLVSLEANLRAIAGAAMLGGVLLTGCPASPAATFYTPYTGIRISSAALFAGYTCGVGPGQAYAYLAVVSDAAEGGPQPAGLPVANVYACGDDGAFQNLPGSGFYNVSIYAYDFASYPAGLGCAPGTCALMLPLKAAQVGTPTWETTCSGIEEPSQNALVQCIPLPPPGLAAMPDASVPPSDVGADDATTVDAGDATTGADGMADATLDGGATEAAADAAVDGATGTDDGGMGDGGDGATDTTDSAGTSDAPDGTPDGTDGM